MIVRYGGWPGTGLRLEDPNDASRCIDAGGGHGGTCGMTLYVGEGSGKPGAHIELAPEDVARLASQCVSWLAWHLSGRGTK